MSSLNFDQLVEDGSIYGRNLKVPDGQNNQKQPSFDDLTDDSEKYSTPGQQLKTAAEGAAQGAIGPLADLAETKLLGVNPEDIRGRKEANPLLHGASQAAGMVGGSLIPGVGEYTLGSNIAKAGEAVTGGSAALKAATEMALIQASDETSKWIERDPNQSIQSAIANIGLSAVLGAAGGAVFSKLGPAAKSLGEAPEEVARGLKKGLDPFTHEPIEYTPTLGSDKVGIDPFTHERIEMPSKPSIKAIEKSYGLGNEIAQAIKDSGPIAVSEGLGASIGAGLGHFTGIPGAGWAGAFLGERALSPMLKSIIPAIGKRVMEMDLSGPGFVSAINAAESAIKGRMLVEKAANSVFQGAFDEQITNKEDIQKLLDKKIRQLQNNPQQTMQVLNNNLDHYMPDHAMSLGQTIGQAINYLNSVRPNEEKKSPLDPTPVPNHIEKQNYQKALIIAEKPLSLVTNIKDGSIVSTDIKHLANMYPALYEQMKSSLLNSMNNHLSKGETVPYKTRLGMSLFMGQPLDSSMTPMSILASQPAVQNPQQIPGGAPGVQNRKHSTSKLGKIASLDQTALQTSELRKQRV